MFGLLVAAMSAPAAERSGAGAVQTELRGAGATFPAPLYKKWIGAYGKLDPGTKIAYAGVGSGEGTKLFLDDAVDFGATDAALTDEQIAGARNGAVLVPATAGMIVLTYNLPGLNGPLKLGRDTYVALLLGKIPKWNDARIQATNPGLNLPDREIVLVARQDASGTTFALTNHLSAINQQWRDRGPGIGKVIGWPPNTMLVRGNEGVAARVKTSVGAVGYVEYGFAKHVGLPVAHLENKAGRFVAPGAGVGEATLTANLSRMPANLRFFLPDPEGTEAYPIVTFSWLVLRQRYSDPAKAQALKRFVAWGLGEGQNLGRELGYIRLPAEVADLGKAALAEIH
jgi:phosphate transport system substrate-binding protein